MVHMTTKCFFQLLVAQKFIQFQTSLLEALFGDTQWFYTQEYRKQNHQAFDAGRFVIDSLSKEDDFRFQKIEQFWMK